MNNESNLIQQHIKTMKEALSSATPGPWVDTEDAVRVGFDKECSWICQMYDHDSESGEEIEYENMKANVHLISNSPTWLQQSIEMLEQQQREIADKDREIERLCRIEFPRQPQKQGGWTINPDYLELVRTEIENCYPADEVPDYEPSWEQTEMVLLAIERIRALSHKEVSTDVQE
ncbi:hypothetical protein D3P07_11455 [Paenibacillus sp. 1011MAR3C5]|uniref:hypothetical protein n=1 Tax=Paenibacillus sp. 1011MAR3C5 TaxID=1675787 RepID=UPI000E6BB731|nr:hypothetical protein [Paenibacillus sp. 1011MAR3C5]RJE88604.1 hypothetical protein D3P07_11455 [Paenibacillus sp. 1011MAR3C5]